MVKKIGKKKTGFISELRRDIVSKDWVVIATERAKRPGAFIKKAVKQFDQPQKTCPFEKLHKEALVVHSVDGKNQGWWVQIIPNKYPTFVKGACIVSYDRGPYKWTEGVGFHEVVITKDHRRHIALMSDEEVDVLLRAYQDRYLALKDDACVKYVSIFHNHGQQAGASISHPHSQIMAIPVIPPDVYRSLKGASNYYRDNRKCVHCVVLKYELEVKDRIVYENDFFLSYVPFASKTAFELRILPKFHSSHFEKITPDETRALANVIRISLKKLYKGLRNPDYNFFLHTSPTEGIKGMENFDYYHWHFEILPKTSIWAGFEIGTGIEVSIMAPEEAAKFLRKIK